MGICEQRHRVLLKVNVGHITWIGAAVADHARFDDAVGRDDRGTNLTHLARLGGGYRLAGN